MKQQLTKEQSRRLIELGVPTEKASSSVVEETQGNGCSWTYPVFTIGDLLEVLPKDIRVEKSWGESLIYDININVKHRKWWVSYRYDIYQEDVFGREEYTGCYDEGIFSGGQLIDALFDLVVWCVENGYIKTEKQ